MNWLFLRPLISNIYGSLLFRVDVYLFVKMVLFFLFNPCLIFVSNNGRIFSMQVTIVFYITFVSTFDQVTELNRQSCFPINLLNIQLNLIFIIQSNNVLYNNYLVVSYSLTLFDMSHPSSNPDIYSSGQINMRKKTSTNIKKQQSEMSALDLSEIQKKPSIQDLSFRANLTELGSPPIRPSKPKQSAQKNKKSLSKKLTINKSISVIAEQEQQKIQFKQTQSIGEDISKQKRVQIQINWKSMYQFMKLILFSYQFNLVQYLREIDNDLTDKVLSMTRIAPGYKPMQYVYLFYTFKYGIIVGTLAALIYPLPYSLLYLYITVDMHIPFIAIFMLAGMRSGTIALLLKYCLHFPRYIFHWIVLIFTVFIGIFLPNNYIYILLFVISIFLSFYINREEGRDSHRIIEELRQRQRQRERQGERQRQNQTVNNTLRGVTLVNFNEQQIYKEYQVIDDLPETYANLSIGIICGFILLIWLLQRYLENRQLSIFEQIFPISFFINSKEMLAFFPSLYQNYIKTSTLSASTLISLSFLFPGPHSKTFMFLMAESQLQQRFIGYMCLYLPSILLTNIFIGYRPYFFTSTYYNIRQSIQAAANGVVFCLVYWMLENQPCFFNSICYSAVVIMVVAKLYRLRELFAITLGIFLISSRTIILNINKGIPFEVQACLNKIQI